MLPASWPKPILLAFVLLVLANVHRLTHLTELSHERLPFLHHLLAVRFHGVAGTLMSCVHMPSYAPAPAAAKGSHAKEYMSWAEAAAVMTGTVPPGQ